MKTNIELNMGINTLDPKAEYIKFEGDNSQLFWRVAGDICNPKAEIIIPETHNAIYVKDGVMQNLLDAGRHPIFDVKKGLFGTKKVGAVSVDVVFMSKTCKLKVLWGTRTPISGRDFMTQIPVEIKANGEFEVQISNPRQFYLELVGSDKSFTVDALRERLIVRMLSYIEPEIASFMQRENISYIDIAANKRKLADNILPAISKLFSEDYGLKVFSFTIADIMIGDEEKAKIEDELKARRVEEKEKKDAKEVAAELERLADKEWDREVYLKKLDQEDHDKYLEVLKILGWSSDAANRKGKGQFCPNCGAPINATMKFCNNCGKPLAGAGKRICPKCGRENESGAAFCSNCGEKL